MTILAIFHPEIATGMCSAGMYSDITKENTPKSYGMGSNCNGTGHRSYFTSWKIF